MSDDNRSPDLLRSFGGTARSLRRARRLTQEELAERCRLSADTIRRIERGNFSPSLQTLAKLSHGLELSLSTLFEVFELGERDESRELKDLIATRSAFEIALATRLLRALFDELDQLAAGPAPDDE